MTDLFPASRMKLTRAAEHVQSLEEAIAAHQTGDWYKVEFGPDGAMPDGTPKWKIHCGAKSLPTSTSAIIGDAIHNLRAALDLLAVRLVDLNGGNTKSVYFPFAEDAASLPKAIKDRNFNRASSADQAELVKLQPYKGGNLALRALHDLDIQDKHHTIIPVSTFLTTPKVGIKLDETGKPIGFDEGKLEMFVEEGPPKVVYVFPEDSPLAKQPMVPTLHELVKLVAGILDLFEAMPR